MTAPSTAIASLTLFTQFRLSWRHALLGDDVSWTCGPRILRAVGRGNTGLIDDELRDRYADLVFTAKIDGKDAVLYVLVEHQSEPDELITFRLLRYMVRLWEELLRSEPKRSKLPAILPVLVLHTASGSGAKGPLAFHDVLDVSDDLLPILGRFLPDFEVLLEDLDRLPVGALRRRQLPPEVELMLFLLKRARPSPALLRELSDFAESLRALAEDRLGLATMVSYILEVREEAPDDVREFFQKHLGEAGMEGFVTGAQQLTEQVRRASEAKGKAEGEAKGKAEGKADDILRVLDRRGIGITESQRAMLLGTTDIEALNRWLDRAIVAASADDVFS